MPVLSYGAPFVELLNMNKVRKVVTPTDLPRGYVRMERMARTAKSESST